MADVDGDACCFRWGILTAGMAVENRAICPQCVRHDGDYVVGAAGVLFGNLAHVQWCRIVDDGTSGEPALCAFAVYRLGGFKRVPADRV